MSKLFIRYILLISFIIIGCNALSSNLKGVWLGNKSSAAGMNVILTFGLRDENNQYIDIVENDSNFNSLECKLNNLLPVSKTVVGGRLNCDFSIITQAGNLDVILEYDDGVITETLINALLRVYPDILSPSHSSMIVDKNYVTSGDKIILVVDPRDIYGNYITNFAPKEIIFVETSTYNIFVPSINELSTHTYELSVPSYVGIYEIDFTYFGATISEGPITVY